jgi:ZIP family zinc transporter
MSSLDLILGAGLAMLATSLGAAGILVFKNMADRLYALVISFSAGMMAFSAFEMITESHSMAGHKVAVTSVLCGIIFFVLLDKLLPHTHHLVLGSEMPDAKKKVVMLAGTITLHNIPEGFAIAAAFANSPALGWLVALSIALQDIPEGLVVSVPVACYGTSPKKSFLYGMFSGVIEFLAAIVGFFFLKTVSCLTPFALGFSGGAMVYVTFIELLPDALKAKKQHLAVGIFLAGIITAYGLSVLFGF